MTCLAGLHVTGVRGLLDAGWLGADWQRLLLAHHSSEME
jgi:hypothetical protein